MSIGRTDKEPSVSVGALNAVRYSAKTLTVGFFKDPSFYIFWLSLIAMLVSLLFGRELPRAFYVILIILAVFRGFRFFFKSPVIEETKTS